MICTSLLAGGMLRRKFLNAGKISNTFQIFHPTVIQYTDILIPDIFAHLGGASGRMSASGLSRHSKPGAHTPQKKLVDGLKQSPHDSPSCLVSFSKSFKINCNVHYRIRRFILEQLLNIQYVRVPSSTQVPGASAIWLLCLHSSPCSQSPIV